MSGNARTTAKVLNGVSWLVLLVGIVWAVTAVCYGFEAEEPWAWAGLLVEEEWESIMFGFFAGAVFLVQALAGWALLQLGSLAATHIASKHMDVLD